MSETSRRVLREYHDKDTDVFELSADTATLAREVEALEEALRPFVDAMLVSPKLPGSRVVKFKIDATVAEIRALRQALEGGS